MLTPRYFNPTIAAGQRINISAYGRFITILSITGAATVRMAIGADAFQPIPSGVAIDCEDRLYTWIALENTGGAGITVELLLSETRVYNDRAAISMSNLIALTTLPRTNVAITGGAATLLFAANTARAIVQIQAFEGNGGYVYLGDTVGVTSLTAFATLGPLDPWWEDLYKGAVYAVGDDAAEWCSGYEV